ncbi:MAG TPA: DNA repair protein RecN [Candidatus Competibacteraceae bacterium]|nr:DNA repair protein RecN [Candidatus Competibacteraceae bacterium]
MLTHLQIRDFAIVEQLELELQPGMTAITGETGAGKSILVDAIGLLLGDRADSGVIRHGAERADLVAGFDLSALPAAREWLAARELGDGGECLLRRVIGPQGRSRAYINGIAQPAQALKELGEMLIDIHGQHAHQSLLQRDLQRQLLDDHAGNQPLLAELGRHFRQWSELRRQLERLRQADAERDARLDLLRFQVNELEALGLKPGELAELEQEHRLLASASRRLEASQQILQWLYENDEVSADTLLGQSLHELDALSILDSRLVPVGELLTSASIQLREACDELRRYARDIDLDPGRLDWIERRLAEIQTLARKHRLSPEELPRRLGELQAELAGLDHSEQRIEALEREMELHHCDYQRIAAELGRRRQATARELGTGVSRAMAGLGMAGGRFEARLEPLERPTAQGLEAVEFWVSANPGQPPRPLAKVASGGELARISLAIQVIAAHATHIPTLIFDEVDSGIGGAVAEVVGRQLRHLGEHRQVLCVTHLPQVAAQAHHHFQVSKLREADTTRTRIARLEGERRVEEIARMLGGIELTASTLAHAREMIDLAARAG